MQRDEVRYISKDWNHHCKNCIVDFIDKEGIYYEEEILMANTFINSYRQEDETIKSIIESNKVF